MVVLFFFVQLLFWTVEAGSDLALSFRPVQSVIGANCNNLTEAVSEKAVSDYVFNDESRRTNHWVRPVRDAGKPMQIGITLAIKAILDIEEKGQIVKLNAFFPIAWRDELHIWNETWPLNCVEYLVIPHTIETGIWLPDIAIMNANQRYLVTQAESELIRIYSDGRISFAPGGILEFYCPFDLSLFPFDEQTCSLEMESWRYTTKNQIFSVAEILLTNATEHQQWAILGLSFTLSEVSYPNGNSFSTLTFYIKLKRKAAYYSLTVVLPSLLSATVEVVTFSTPYNKGIRLEVSFTCLLAFSVFQTMIVTDMPKSADHPPLLLIMICLLTIYIGVAIFLQSFCMILGGLAQSGRKAPPKWAFKFANFMAAGGCISRFEVLEFELYNTVEKDPSTSVRAARRLNRKQWDYIAVVADRYSFYFFCFILAFSTTVILLVIPAATRK